MKISALLFLLLVLAGCPATNVPVSAADASAPCVAACAVLAGVGCPIGSDPGCPTFLQTVEDSGHVPTSTGVPVTCSAVMEVKSRSGAQALGFTCL